MKLRPLATLAAVLVLGGACSDSSERKAGPEQLFDCVPDGKETFGQLNQAESRCLCRRSGEAAHDVLMGCIDEDRYDDARADCDSFAGYASTCDVRFDDWLACRRLAAEVTS